MANPTDKPTPGKLWQSIVAVMVGAITVIATSLGTDQLFHVLEIFPPWDQPMNEFGDNLLALSYRVIYGILGSYVTAALAPHSPWRHIWIGAAIGFVLSGLGCIAAITANLGPVWYPVALWLSTFPCAWLAGKLFQRRYSKIVDDSQIHDQ